MSWERNYDNWKLASPYDDEKIACQCEYCEEDIYVGQEIYKADGNVFCDKDCCIEYLLDESGASADYMEDEEDDRD